MNAEDPARTSECTHCPPYVVRCAHFGDLMIVRTNFRGEGNLCGPVPTVDPPHGDGYEICWAIYEHDDDAIINAEFTRREMIMIGREDAIP